MAAIDKLRDDKGLLPTYAWPGGYPIYYLTADCGVLCPACANGPDAVRTCLCPGDKQWCLIAHAVHYEGPPLPCDHCGALIESAYGDPENPEEG